MTTMKQQHDTLGHYPTDTLPGDVIACRSHGWSPLSWLIRKRTGSQINHVADCIGDGLMVEALGGVVLTKTSRLTTEWWVHLRPDYLVPSAAFNHWQNAQVGKAYDWKAIWGFGPWNSLDKPNGNDGKWFCSEKTFAAHRDVCGVKLLERRPNGYVTPNDIYESSRLKIIGYQWPKSLSHWLEETTP